MEAAPPRLCFCPISERVSRSIFLRSWSSSLASGVALQFAPEEGTAFFNAAGWRETRFVSMGEEARRLRREIPMAHLFRLIGRFLSPERREAFRRFTGTVLLER